MLRNFARILILGLLGAACAKKTPPVEPPPKVVEKKLEQKADQPKPKRVVEAERAPSPAPLRPIYFDFDQATIREEGKETIQRIASELSHQPAARIEIEGHCDVRGSIEYNLHLGERRARTVQKYLQDLGITMGRASVISYGEEKLAADGSSREDHQLNRRAEIKKR